MLVKCGVINNNAPHNASASLRNFPRCGSEILLTSAPGSGAPMGIGIAAAITKPHLKPSCDKNVQKFHENWYWSQSRRVVTPNALHLFSEDALLRLWFSKPERMAPMIYTLYGFAIFFFVFWCSMWILHLIAIFYGYVLVTPTNMYITSNADTDSHFFRFFLANTDFIIKSLNWRAMCRIPVFQF